jgi:hypothetical protein
LTHAKILRISVGALDAQNLLEFNPFRVLNPERVLGTFMT